MWKCGGRGGEGSREDITARSVWKIRWNEVEMVFVQMRSYRSFLDFGN
jgi:hypothetical protein